MFGLGFNEIVLIGLFLVILFYGSDKLIDLARSAGKLTGEYKKSKLAIDKELKEIDEIKDSVKGKDEVS